MKDGDEREGETDRERKKEGGVEGRGGKVEEREEGKDNRLRNGRREGRRKGRRTEKGRRREE